MSTSLRHDSGAYVTPPNSISHPQEDFEKNIELQRTSIQTPTPPSALSPSLSSQYSSPATILHHSRMTPASSAADIPLPNSPMEKPLTVGPLSLASFPHLRRPPSLESVLTIRARKTPDRTYRAPTIPGRFYQPMPLPSDTESQFSEPMTSTKMSSNPCYSSACSTLFDYDDDDSEKVYSTSAESVCIPSLYGYNIREHPVPLDAIAESPQSRSISSSLLRVPNIDVYSVNQAAPISLVNVTFADVNFVQGGEYEPVMASLCGRALVGGVDSPSSVLGSVQSGVVEKCEFETGEKRRWRCRFRKCIRRALSCGGGD